MKFSVLCAGALMALAFWLMPVAVAAQCEGCNNLTDKCGSDEPNPQIECYEDEDESGDPYCHAYGGDEGCMTVTMGADGLSPLESVIPRASNVAMAATGITTLIDCRGRIRAMVVTSELGEDLRKQAARIDI